jgi:hypothetical protein
MSRVRAFFARRAAFPACSSGSVVWTAAAVVAVLAPLAARDVSPEYRLKAAVISKFPQFVEWPPTAWGDADSLTLCVTQPNPFGATLDEITAGERIQGRRAVVREIAAVDRSQGCHLLFVSGPGPLPPGTVADRVRQPMLTVSDRPGFLDAGGMVELKLVDGRVRFDINAEAAERVGLRISAQLLRLAGEVRGGRP